MINFKKLKSQLHRCGFGNVTGYVFEPTVQQIEDSEYEIFPVRIEGSKRRAIMSLVCIIYADMRHWRKEFTL